MNLTPILFVLAVSCCQLSGDLTLAQSVLERPVPSQSDDSRLTAESAMEFLKSEAGRWQGTRESYPTGENGESITTKVTILNKIEADSWLYFQMAEVGENGTRMAKGTLAYSSDTGRITRRWFDNGSPGIKVCAVAYDAPAKTLTYSWTTPGNTPEPDDNADPSEFGNDNVVIGDGVPSMIYTNQLTIRDSNTRVIKVYTQPSDNRAQTPTLRSTLILSRVRAVARGNNKTRQRLPAQDRPTPPPEPTPDQPVTHTLLVKVKIASSDLRQDQQPILEIVPDDGSSKRVNGNTFEFSGLKSGVEYTIKGEYQIESGFRVFTSGEMTWEFPKDAKSKIKKTKFLTLEGE